MTPYAVLWCSEFSNVQVYDWSEDCYRMTENCQSIEVVVGYRNDFHKYFRKRLRKQIYILVEVKKKSNSAFHFLDIYDSHVHLRSCIYIAVGRVTGSSE
jgi:hypothetical protein